VNTQASSLTALHPKPPDGSMAQLTYDWVTELKGQWWRFPEGFRPSIPRFFTAVCERNYTHQEASPDSDEGGFPLKSKRGVALFRIDPDGWANLLWGFYPVWFNQRQPPPNDQTAPNVTVQNMADYYVHDALVPL
jgi:hypothetical protein